ncbi:MAG: hypothetical protein U5M23_06295 [Marinagarivorans sp.]|nr:hypothetical protein [Marinagarivorans sp.]
MNLDPLNNELIESLKSWRDCFAYIVYKKKSYWILDWESHFNLDQRKNFKASLSKGILSEERYEQVLLNYRCGIPQLTEETFDNYLALVRPHVFTTEEVRDFFFNPQWGDFRNLSGQVEDYLSFGAELTSEDRKLCGWFRAMLPKFYINFDRKIFLHLYEGRMHDKVVNDGWYGAFCDFEHMIPCSHRYWLRSLDEDLWSVTNIS